VKRTAPLHCGRHQFFSEDREALILLNFYQEKLIKKGSFIIKKKISQSKGLLILS